MKVKSIKDQLKEYFFINPTRKLRVREIEREVRIHLPSAIKYSKELERGKIIKNEVISNIKLYSADRSYKTFLLEKREYNIKALYHSGLIEYLIERYNNPVIILFGSYGKGEDIESSDIDLYLEISNKNKIDLKQFEKKLNKNIQVFIYRNIKEVENKELANNILNGITINNFVEVFK